MLRLRNQEDGFTVIEAVMAQVVMIIGGLSILSVFFVGARLNAESEDRTIAANIAQIKMEEIMT